MTELKKPIPLHEIIIKIIILEHEKFFNLLIKNIILCYSFKF